MKKRFSAVQLAVLALSLPVSIGAFGQAASLSALQEVLVTGSRVTGPLEGQPFGTSVITAEDIQRSGASTVNEAIMRLLGVPGRQDSFGGADYALDLRGFGTTADSNQVVVVDGIRISEADMGGTRLAGIPIESVTRIEVIRGSGAVLYGEGATGGVIIVTTKSGKGVTRKNGASVYAAAGNLGLREGRANATLANGGFSLDVNAMERQADNHRDNFASRTNALSVVAQWSNDWLRAGASRAEDKLSSGLPGALTAAEYEANPRQTTHPLDRAKIENLRQGLFAEAVLGAWVVSADAGSREKTLRSVNDYGFGPSAYDYNIKADSYGLRAAHNSKTMALSNRLVLGSDYATWNRMVLGDYASTADQQSRAFYFRNELTLASGGTAVTVGGRTEKISKTTLSATTGNASLTDRQNAWELGIRQPLSTAASVYGRVGESFRLANVDEFNAGSPGISLLPQRSKDLEIGTRYAVDALKADLRWYRSALRDEIGFDPNAASASPFFSGANVNFDRTRRTGLELDTTYAYAKNLNLRVNAALRKSFFVAGPYAGTLVPLAPKRSVAIFADWAPVQQHLVSGGVHWVSPQHPDFANECSIPSYVTANARYAYRWSNAEFSLAIANLTDRKFYTQAYFCDGGKTTNIYPDPGRAVTASVRFAF